VFPLKLFAPFSVCVPLPDFTKLMALAGAASRIAPLKVLVGAALMSSAAVALELFVTTPPPPMSESEAMVWAVPVMGQSREHRIRAATHLF
jgi:hypothetical protein